MQELKKMSDILEEMKKEDVPEMLEFRKYVDTKIPKLKDRTLIKLVYLTAARASEVCTRVGSWDAEHGRSKPYGKALTLQVFPKTDIRNKWVEDVALIRMAVAKRSRKKIFYKIIGLPCSPVYEPWTYDLLVWALKHGKQLSFDLSRFGVWHIIKRNLTGLDPKAHPHSLRHYRATHLVDIYGFDPYEICLYTGWTLSSDAKSSRQLDRYVHLNWRRYFPKLLVPCRYKTALAEKVLDKERQRKEEIRRQLEFERQQREGGVLV